MLQSFAHHALTIITGLSAEWLLQIHWLLRHCFLVRSANAQWFPRLHAEDRLKKILVFIPGEPPMVRARRS